MKNKRLKNCLPFLLMVLFISKGFAFVKPNSLFSNNMVLQRGVAVPIWGTANDGERVTVEFYGQKVFTVAKYGKWIVRLHPLKVSRKPLVMTISGENTIKIENILVGEAWVCSGQSNMQMTLISAWSLPITNAKEEIAAANYPEIRQYHIVQKGSDTLMSDGNAKWEVCDTTSVKGFSAVAYFFARDLYKKLKVPIGLLFSAVGGTPAENWTTRASLEANPTLKPLVESYFKAVKNYPQALDSFNKHKEEIMGKWLSDSLSASNEHKIIPRKPRAPGNPLGGAGGLYNAMINPLIPFAIKGVIWYQGEANTRREKQYCTLFPTLINEWRKNWNQGDFPFLFVQIAPYSTPEIREAQLLTLDKVSNIAMVTTTDCGDSIGNHPRHKQPVGYRLSLAARALGYNEKIEYSGPLYKGFQIKDNTVEISFTHIGKGLVSKDGELRGFIIAGEDKKFIPAKATIKGEKIIVSNESISKPIAVRYGWKDSPNVNLFNQEGLPASTFRTDVE